MIKVKTHSTHLTRFMSLLPILLLMAALGMSQVFLSGCGDEDDDECLSWGENCTQDYLQNNYGRTDVYCCEGQCADHGGYLTCGS